MGGSDQIGGGGSEGPDFTPDLRSFLGGLRASEKGVYVSTGGFSKEAKYEADRANNPTTLIDLDMLVNLIVQHYDNFDTETRAYWPL